MGAWINYGLGSETENLPGFVVMTSVGGVTAADCITSMVGRFLPSRFQGVEFNSTGDPVHYVSNPVGVTCSGQRSVVDAVQALDRYRNQKVKIPRLRRELLLMRWLFGCRHQF